jgi:hypothetical protein
VTDLEHLSAPSARISLDPPSAGIVMLVPWGPIYRASSRDPGQQRGAYLPPTTLLAAMVGTMQLHTIGWMSTGRCSPILIARSRVSTISHPCISLQISIPHPTVSTASLLTHICEVWMLTVIFLKCLFLTSTTRIPNYGAPIVSHILICTPSTPFCG